MDSGRLLLFEEVVRRGSFAAAARALGITRQSVSDQIAQLEEELGVRLLERTTRRHRLTDAGELLHERGRAVAELVREAEAEMMGLQQAPVGRLRVSAPAAFGRRFLADIALALRERHPALTVEVDVTNRYVDLVAEGYDAAIRVGPLADSTMTCRKIGMETVCYVASPAFLEREGVPTADDFDRLPIVGPRARESWSVGPVVKEVEPAVVVDDLHTVCELAVASLGMARLPSFLTEHARSRGELVLLFEGAVAATRELWVVYPSRRFLAPKVRCFVEAVVERATPSFTAAATE